MVDLGLQLLHIAKKVKVGKVPKPLTIRVGIHTGPAVGGVVGRERTDGLMRYSIFGESCTV